MAKAKKLTGFDLITGLSERPEAMKEAVDKYERGLELVLGTDPRKIRTADIRLAVAKMRADRVSWVDKQRAKGKDE